MEGLVRAALHQYNAYVSETELFEKWFAYKKNDDNITKYAMWARRTKHKVSENNYSVYDILSIYGSTWPNG